MCWGAITKKKNVFISIVNVNKFCALYVKNKDFCFHLQFYTRLFAKLTS